MAETAYLASAFVTGVLLLGVWTLIARMENWRSYDSSAAASGGGLPTTTSGRERADDSTGAWIVGFLLLVLVAGGGAVVLVSDASLAAAVGNWVALAVVFGVLLGAYLLWGTYSSVRHRGLPSAHAALVSAWLFGSLFVVGIAVKLLLTGG